MIFCTNSIGTLELVNYLQRSEATVTAYIRVNYLK